MKAVRVHQFGGPEALVFEEVPRPVPGAGQVLVRVWAAGVGPWDAWVRAGQSVIPQPLPLTLGSDISGIVEAVGPGVSGFRPGDAVFGVTNTRFTDGYAEYAVAEAAMLAPKPEKLSHVEAASVPVVATTAWQMVHQYGQVDAGKRVLIHGGAGNVGAYAVQFARQAGAHVTTAVSARDMDYVRALGADEVLDRHTTALDTQGSFDVVLDTVGGATLNGSFALLKPGGVLVSSAGQPDPEKADHHGVRALFFLVEVTTEGLTQIGELLDSGQITTTVGEVLPLAEARRAHEMLAGLPHMRGKIVLSVGA